MRAAGPVTQRGACNRATLICFCSCFLAFSLVVRHHTANTAESLEAEWEYSRRQLYDSALSTSTAATARRAGGGGDQISRRDLGEEDAPLVVPPRLPSASAQDFIAFDEAIHKPPLPQQLLDFSRPGFLSFVNPPRDMDRNFSFRCPGYRVPSSKSADGKSVHEHVAKYSRYVNQYCNHTGMLQMNVEFKTYGWILDKIASMARIKVNDRILDWGSGCGTMLNYFHLKFNTSGIGIDLTEPAVHHSIHHAQPDQQFCHMDGSNMRPFPSESFDAIVSWATLYHIRRTLVQCDVVHNFVRMLKPGGVAYVGHLRTEKTQEYWKKGRCRHENATIVRYRDFKTFHQPSWKRHQFFSVIVTKHKDGQAVAVPQEDG